MNWTGAPGLDPLEMRWSIRRPMWRYRMTHLRHAHFSSRMMIFRTDQWWPSLHGTPIMCSVRTGPGHGSPFTTYDKTPMEWRVSITLSAASESMDGG